MMNTYTNNIEEMRKNLDMIINRNEALDLTSAELIKKAMMIEKELSTQN